MRQRDQQLYNLVTTENRSKAKIKWVFADELQIMQDDLEEFLEEKLSKLYEYVDIDSWSKNFKIKVDDSEKYIQKLIKCHFEHTKADEKYFNTRIQLTFTELSKAPLIILVWRFSILDLDKIKTETLKFLIKWIDLIIE